VEVHDRGRVEFLELAGAMEETRRSLKLDVDGRLPEWRRLAIILNFVRLFPHAEIYRSSLKDGHYHLVARGVPTDASLRRLLGDDPVRVEVSTVTGTDVIFQWKARFRLVKGRIAFTQRRIPYEPCTLRDVLGLPWFSRVPRSHYVRRRGHK